MTATTSSTGDPPRRSLKVARNRGRAKAGWRASPSGTTGQGSAPAGARQGLAMGTPPAQAAGVDRAPTRHHLSPSIHPTPEEHPMPTLPTRKLGTNGPEITRLGLGTWAIGGGDWAFGWGPQDDDAALDAMRHALDLGINWIDTAATYGLGHAEVLVGRLLREVPEADRPFVFTKGGMVWDEANPKAPPVKTLEPASIRRECEASLRRLGVERIDLYQFHFPDEAGVPIEDSWGEMVRLVEEGKVRWAGVSNFDVALLERCEAIRHVDSIQPPFSAIRRQAATEIAWAAAHGTGVIVYSPMESGLLTERWSLDRVQRLDPDDWRRRSPRFRSPEVEKNLALRDAL